MPGGTHAGRRKAFSLPASRVSPGAIATMIRLLPQPRRDLLVFGRSLDAFLKRDVGAKLNRYESALQRQLSALMLEVRRMQARRYAQGSPQAGMEPAIGEGGVVVPLRAFGSQDAADGEADPERAEAPVGVNREFFGYECLFALWPAAA